MTEKLYYIDSYKSRFKAAIIDIFEIKGNKCIVLDQTCFFPEGGGQKSDVGFINGVYIYDVQETDGVIFHYTKDEITFNCGDLCNCHIDWSVRFLRMQSHTGEHILSGLANKLFGASNVGFHMDEAGIMTVDFDCNLTKEQISFLESEVNKCIYSNKSVTADIYRAEDADLFEFRSKKDFDDDIRIVTIDEIDACACCAPHVKSTGEIGLLKITQSVSHRGGIRLSVVCSDNAFKYFTQCFNEVHKISALLCAPYDEISAAVLQLINQNKDNKRFYNDLRSRFLAYVSENEDHAIQIIRFFDEFSMDELRMLSNELCLKAEIGVYLFSGNDTDGYCYCFNSDKINLTELLKEMRSCFNLSGGGRGNIVQGKINAGKQEILNYLNEKSKLL